MVRDRPSSKLFLDFVDAHRGEYRDARDKAERDRIANRVVESLRDCGHSFLKSSDRDISSSSLDDGDDDISEEEEDFLTKKRQKEALLKDPMLMNVLRSPNNTITAFSLENLLIDEDKNEKLPNHQYDEKIREMELKIDFMSEKMLEMEREIVDFEGKFKKVVEVLVND